MIHVLSLHDKSASGNEEWPQGRVAGSTDHRADDDVDIVIRADSTVEVAYRGSATGC